MIEPIVVYDNQLLKQQCSDIGHGQNVSQLIETMQLTMSNANGIGLAAPQIGILNNLFVVSIVNEYFSFNETFINPRIVEEFGSIVTVTEGCLSIPKLYIPIQRPSTLKIEYYNKDWEKVTKTYDGMVARVIQHEYDHLQGKLFIDKIANKNYFIRKALEKINNGEFETTYETKR